MITIKKTAILRCVAIDETLYSMVLEKLENIEEVSLDWVYNNLPFSYTLSFVDQIPFREQLPFRLGVAKLAAEKFKNFEPEEKRLDNLLDEVAIFIEGNPFEFSIGDTFLPEAYSVLKKYKNAKNDKGVEKYYLTFIVANILNYIYSTDRMVRNITYTYINKYEEGDNILTSKLKTLFIECYIKNRRNK